MNIYFCEICKKRKGGNSNHSKCSLTKKQKLVVNGGKKCVRCNELKPIIQFKLNKSVNGGVLNTCKSCQKKGIKITESYSEKCIKRFIYA